MAYSKIFSKIAQGTSATATTSATSADSTGANLLVIGRCVLNSGSSTPTDSLGNTWTNDVNHDNTATLAQIWHSVPTFTGSSHTATSPNNANTFPTIWFAPYSGAAASPADQVNGAGGSGTVTHLQTGSVTPTSGENTELVISLCADAWTNTLSVTDSTMDLQLPLVGGTSFALAVATEIQTTLTTRNPDFTNIGSVRANAAIATFKAAAVTATDVIPLYQSIGMGPVTSYGLGAN